MTGLSIATTNVPGALPQKLEQIAAAGFTGVEIYEPDLTGYAGSAEEIGQLARSLGLQIHVLQPFHDFEGLSGASRKLAFARLHQKLEVLEGLGAQTLMIGTSTHPEASSDISQITDDFSELAECVAKVGRRAALIALPWARHITREVEALEIVETVDSSAFGLALNSFFSLAGGGQAARLRNVPGDRIFHVQLSDAPALEFDITRLKSHFSLLPGQGGLNLESFVRIVARAGYAGTWSISRVGATAEGSRTDHARDAFRALVSLLDV